MLPNFLIAGTIKGATSALWSYLYDHPDIYFAKEKELRFFTSLRYNKGLEWYKKQFKNHKNEKIIGEATPYLLSEKEAPQRIYEIIPAVKLLFSLRNPIDRAYSHYWMKVKFADETRSFEKALEDELKFLNINKEPRTARYISIGFYYEHINRYLKYFDKQNMYFILFEDFAKHPKTAMKKIYKFLEVDETYVPANIGKVIHPSLKSGFSLRFPMLLYLIYYLRLPFRIVYTHFTSSFDRLYMNFNYFLIKLHEKINTIPNTIPEMKKETRELLNDIFSQHNKKLADFLQLDLSCWK